MAKAGYFFCILLLLVFTPLWAQTPSQPVRLELPYSKEATQVEVLALPDSSLLVYHKVSNAWQTKASHYFTKYNQHLETMWADTAGLLPTHYYLHTFTEAPYTYLIFGNADPQKYTVVRAHLGQGKLDIQEYTLEMVDAVHTFCVLQGQYFLIGKSKKDGQPLLVYLDPESGESKPLPAIYGKESTFSDLLADPANGRVDVVISESNGRIARLQVKSFDARGELIQNKFILPRSSRLLLNAEVTPGDSATKLLVGTYSTRNARYAQGFFSTSALSGASTPEFYTMLQLKNFLSFKKPRHQERIRRREAARLQDGKEPGYHYQLLLHNLISTPTGYVLAAEIYYPQFQEKTYARLNWTPSTGRGPIGYKHTHVVVLGLDKDGLLLWDNIFPLKDIFTPSLAYSVEVGVGSDGRVIIAYPTEDKIIYRVLQEDKYTDEHTELTPLTHKEDEKIVATNEQGIINWYNHHFAAFGFQQIKSVEGTRYIFYINKISF